jgi:FRG domain
MRFVIQNVRNLAELNRRIAKIPRHRSELVFRGQTSLHGGRIAPSFARMKNRPPRKFQYFHDLWLDVLGAGLLNRTLSFPVNWFNGPETRNDATVRLGGLGPVEQGAILQHYGERSHFVDVTTSLQVALWFAHHDWTSRNVPERRQGEAPREHFCATYKKTLTKYGYLFVLRARRRNLGVLKPRHGELIDISSVQTTGRMTAQRAALIYTNIDRANGDISEQVVAVFRFAIPLSDAASLNWPTTALFPPPERDPFFALLLSSTPYLPGAPRQEKQRRLMRLPEYHDTIKFRQSV